MDDQVYKHWVIQLTHLSKDQLTDLSNRMKILSFATTKEFSGKADMGVRVSEAVCSVFRRLGTECPNPNTLRRSQSYTNAKAKFDDLANFFEKISKHRLVQDGVLVVGIEELYNCMLQWKVPVSSHTVLNHIH